VLFTGRYEHTIDSKQRLAVPAHIRARWRVEEDGAAWIGVPWTGGIIRLYTESDFARRASTSFLSLTPDEDEAELQATLFGLSERMETDSAGRIRLSGEILELSGLGAQIKDVIIIGAGDRLEIRDRAAWNSTKSSRVAQLPELIARISAKRERTGR
jgi:MraZ protein